MPFRPLSIGTLAAYLFGYRDAIAAFAEHPMSLWIGLVFVVSAGLAREYDGEDLLREPWHLLLPLAASLVTSFLLFNLMNLIGWRRGAGFARMEDEQKGTPAGYWRRYRVFLSLYWMTAPLAWLYAIPVERFMTEGPAATANIWLLALVSLWRVLLITRVCSLLYGTSFASCFFPVMLFADTFALWVVSKIDLQIFVMMGGVKMTETQSALATAKAFVTFWGVLSWPVWAIGTIVVLWNQLPKWEWKVPRPTATQGATLSLRWLAAISVAMWALILPWTQPEQQMRSSVVRLLNAGQYKEAVEFLSNHRPEDFPRYWNPTTDLRREERGEVFQSLRDALPAEVKDREDPENIAWVRKLIDDGHPGLFPWERRHRDPNEETPEPAPSESPDGNEP